MKKVISLTIILVFNLSLIYGQSKKDWEKVQSLNSKNVYQQFIINYPNGKYTELAKQKLAQLTQENEATATKSVQLKENAGQKSGQDTKKYADPLYPGELEAGVKKTEVIESAQKFRTLLGNSLYIEGGGNAFSIGSINFERMLFHENQFYLTGRVGFGFEPFDEKDSSKSHYYFFPIMLNIQFQLSNSFVLEFGAGQTIAHDSWEEHIGSWGSYTTTPRKDFYYLITGLAGIRLQTTKGFLFRVGFTPIINKSYETFIPFNKFTPWAGASLGFCFGK